jgi:hypothetical protein
MLFLQLHMMDVNNFLAQAYSLYKTEFERLFSITGNGSLQASWARLNEINAFIRNFNLLIVQSSGFQFNNFAFVQAYRGDIGTSNENKTKLLQVYAVCFCVYSQVCSTLRAPCAHSYNLITKLDYIIDADQP